jgi:hypothetical protein
MNVKFPNNTIKWQMELNLAFKGLKCTSVISNDNSAVTNLYEVKERVWEHAQQWGKFY